MSGRGINDDERRLWVLNDEGLYRDMRAAHPGKRDGEYNIRDYVRTHRAEIDAAIRRVTEGKPQ